MVHFHADGFSKHRTDAGFRHRVGIRPVGSSALATPYLHIYKRLRSSTELHRYCGPRAWGKDATSPYFCRRSSIWLRRRKVMRPWNGPSHHFLRHSPRIRLSKGFSAAAARSTLRPGADRCLYLSGRPGARIKGRGVGGLADFFCGTLSEEVAHADGTFNRLTCHATLKTPAARSLPGSLRVCSAPTPPCWAALPAGVLFRAVELQGFVALVTAATLTCEVNPSCSCPLGPGLHTRGPSTQSAGAHSVDMLQGDRSRSWPELASGREPPLSGHGSHPLSSGKR